MTGEKPDLVNNMIDQFLWLQMMVLSEKPECKEKTLELLLLGTRTEYQGQGLGRTMLHHVFQYAHGKGYKFVDLETPKDTPALGFYLREGFQVEREIAMPAMPPEPSRTL